MPKRNGNKYVYGICATGIMRLAFSFPVRVPRVADVWVRKVLAEVEHPEPHCFCSPIRCECPRRWAARVPDYPVAVAVFVEDSGED